MLHHKSTSRRLNRIALAVLVTAGLITSTVVQAGPYQYRHAAQGLVAPITAAAFKVQGSPAVEQSFGTAVLNVSAQPFQLDLMNQGGSTGDFALPTLGGTHPADFSVQSTCTSVAPKASCAITVGFKPKAIGVRTATMTVDGVLYTFTGNGQYGIQVSTAIYQYYAGGGSHPNITITTSLASMCNGQTSCFGSMGTGERGSIGYYCGATLKWAYPNYGQAVNGPLPFTLSCP